MKKVLMMLALMAIPFAMQGQTKFHDVEANDTDAVYDANGFLQSMKMSFQGNEVTIKYTWKDGKLATQSMDMMGNPMTFIFTYNDKGAIASQSMDMGGQEMKMEYTDYKYDAKGNWISRKTQMMGQDMEQTRTIEYYE